MTRRSVAARYHPVLIIRSPENVINVVEIGQPFQAYELLSQ